MEYLWIAFIAVLTFDVCFLIDKLFTRLFRSKRQHQSGLQVRLRKRVATFGLLVGLLGAVCVVFYWGRQPVLFISGWLLLLMAAALVYYYLSFGIYYDQDGFVYSRFGKKSQLYTYDQITHQQLYNSQGSILVELHLAGGDTVPVQDTMEGADAFLDYAFDRWLEAKGWGCAKEDCAFHDPSHSCWFPPAEVV